jgi:hypothetical protein
MVSGFLSFTGTTGGDPIARRRAASIASFRFRSSLLHPHTRTTAVLRDKLNAGLFESLLNGLANIVGHGRALAIVAL